MCRSRIVLASTTTHVGKQHALSRTFCMLTVVYYACWPYAWRCTICSIRSMNICELFILSAPKTYVTNENNLLLNVGVLQSVLFALCLRIIPIMVINEMCCIIVYNINTLGCICAVKRSCVIAECDITRFNIIIVMA